MDCSLPGSSIHGIFQARVLEWVAISFSSAWKWKVKGKSLSRVRLLANPWTAAYQAPPSMGFSRQKYWSRVPPRSSDTDVIFFNSLFILIKISYLSKLAYRVFHEQHTNAFLLSCVFLQLLFMWPFLYVVYVVSQYPVGRHSSILKLELDDLSRDSWLV